ncbi:hypothetical protein WMF21_06255 [Sorangium sp. So ce1099]
MIRVIQQQRSVVGEDGARLVERDAVLALVCCALVAIDGLDKSFPLARFTLAPASADYRPLECARLP